MSERVLPVLSNRDARKLFLAAHGLLGRPGGDVRAQDIAATIENLGFVQVDSINTLARAHDHILWSRRPRYRQGRALTCVARNRSLFEAWTHDAALVPAAFFPHWRHKHATDREALAARWKSWGRDGFEGEIDRILRRISSEGEQSAAELGDGTRQNGGGWWEWQPNKVALEYLWRTGELAICHRRSFMKVYDLTERVIPPEHLNARRQREDSLDWSARAALARLGFATPSELAAFWEIFSKKDLADWAERLPEDLVEIDVEMADGSKRRSLIHADWESRLAALPDPSRRARILNPFDPALRDRTRLSRLFGFTYRIEVFVPAAKRRYGYYVFPILEGTRFTGRIDLKADRDAGVLRIKGYWPEADVKLGRGRAERLSDELSRLSAFAETSGISLEAAANTAALRAAPAFTALY